MHPQSSKAKDSGAIFRTKEHKGCGIRAASYQVMPGKWVPEACFWVYTENGWRRLWIQSFAHCFSMPELTCANKIEADNWAFRMARTVIDRTLPDFDRCEPPNPGKSNVLNCLAKVWGLALRPFLRHDIYKEN
jgi:hypothetical protein